MGKDPTIPPPVTQIGLSPGMVGVLNVSDQNQGSEPNFRVNRIDSSPSRPICPHPPVRKYSHVHTSNPPYSKASTVDVLDSRSSRHPIRDSWGH